jgi:hypothetical protein
MYFCSDKKIITIGIEARIDPAAKGPQFSEYCPPINCCNPTATVLLSMSTKKSRAKMNSLKVPIKLRSATTAKTGEASGTKISQKV